MGFASPHVIGRVGRAAVIEQTALGTLVKPTSTPVTAFPYISHSINYNPNRRERIDKRDTRALIERIEGRKDVEWELETYIILDDGALGDAGPHDLFLKNVLGGTSVDQGAYREYAGADGASALACMTIVFEQSDGSGSSIRQDHLIGAVVNEFGITWGIDDEPKMRFSGMAHSHVLSGRGALSASITASADAILGAGETRQFEVGGLVQIAGSSPLASASDGFQITAVNHATNTLTLDTTITSAPNAAVVSPYFGGGDFDATLSPASEVEGQIDLDLTSPETDIDFVGFDLTYSNNIKKLVKPGDPNVADFLLARRAVTGTLTLFGKQSDMLKIHRTKYNNATDVNPIPMNVFIGGSSTETPRMELRFPEIELDYNFEVPDGSSDDEAQAALPYTAFAINANPSAATDFELLVRTY
jgi:hypothetical protein